MFTTSKPPMAQNQIPKVRELQEQLGFDGTNGRSPADLGGPTHHFRREYLTSDGTPGRDLKDWKSSRTQAELLRMARTFLEDEHYGIKFWSASANSSSKRVLEYPKDSDKLAELLQQLFWRQNKYSAHNANHPDRGCQVQESVKSDRSSVTVQPNKNYSVNHPRSFDLSDQVPQSLPSRVGTDDNRSEDAPNSSRLSSPPYETRGAVEKRKGNQKMGSNEKQESIGAFANQDEEDGTTQIEKARPRGVAPEAKMLASQEIEFLEARQKPIRPDHGVTTEKAPTSKTKLLTESERAKRRDVEDDDPDYIPSKKLKGKRGFPSNPPRRRTRNIAGTDPVLSSQPADSSELGRPSTPEDPNISVERSPSMSLRTPLLHKHKERSKQEKSQSDSMNEVDRGHRQTVLDSSPASKAVEIRAQSGGIPYMGLYDTRARGAGQAAADESDHTLNTDGDILEHDGARSQISADTGLAIPEPAHNDPPPQITDIAIEIRYSIIASRIPRLVKRHWRIRSLSGKTVRNLFEEVSNITSKPDIQRIDFRLNLSQADSEYTIRKDDHHTFEAMKDEFADDIMTDWKENGITKFIIWLEPDPTEEGNQMNLGAPGVLDADRGRPRITI